MAVIHTTYCTTVGENSLTAGTPQKCKHTFSIGKHVFFLLYIKKKLKSQCFFVTNLWNYAICWKCCLKHYSAGAKIIIDKVLLTLKKCIMDALIISFVILFVLFSAIIFLLYIGLKGRAEQDKEKTYLEYMFSNEYIEEYWRKISIIINYGRIITNFSNSSFWHSFHCHDRSWIS